MNTARPASSGFSFFSKSKVASAGPSGTKVSVTTRVVTVPRSNTPSTTSQSGSVKVIARDATLSSSGSISRKRELDAPAAPLRVAKRQRTSTSPSVDPHSRASSSLSSLRAPDLRESSIASSGRRIRSPSMSPLTTPEPPEPSELEPGHRKCWTEERGQPESDFLSCEAVVKENLKQYIAYFKNLSDPKDRSFEPNPTSYPVVELEYPNTGASESFALLVPKDPDLFNPLACLESTLYQILESYLTPEQRSLFGTPPDLRLQQSTDGDDLEDAPSLRNFVASAASPSCSESSLSSLSSSSVSSASSISSVFSSVSSVSSLSSISDLQHFASPSYNGPPTVDYLKLFRRAVNDKDGPFFLKVMDAINSLLRAFKYPSLSIDPFEPSPPNVMMELAKSWTYPDIPERVLMRILAETYDRAVKPHALALSKYKAFSSEVYGELLPPFVSELIKTTGLNENSLFVDLGSGVGSVVMQASLTTGCRSFGVELLPTPAKIARSQSELFHTRCRMWGLKTGKVELEEGDMLKSQRALTMLKDADVVLVNNKVFTESLNDSLRVMFLDLKDGAIVISLQPFKTGKKIDLGSIFQVKKETYCSGSVSWTSQGGSYFVHRVDRTRVGETENSSTRSSRSRSTRSSR